MDVEELKKSRATAKRMFTKSKNNLNTQIEKERDLEIVESRMGELRLAYRTAQEKHEEYMSGLGYEEEDERYVAEDKWITTVDTDFDDAEVKKVA